MAARKNPEINDHWREKIRTGVLVDRLQKHAEGDIEMSSTQIRAAEILMKKVIPDLGRTELTGKDGAPIETKDVTESDADILARYYSQKGTKS